MYSKTHQIEQVTRNLEGYAAIPLIGVTMTLCLYARSRFRPSSLLDKEVIAPCGTSVPCQLRQVVRRHGRGLEAILA